MSERRGASDEARTLSRTTDKPQTSQGHRICLWCGGQSSSPNELDGAVCVDVELTVTRGTFLAAGPFFLRTGPTGRVLDRTMRHVGFALPGTTSQHHDFERVRLLPCIHTACIHVCCIVGENIQRVVIRAKTLLFRALARAGWAVATT